MTPSKSPNLWHVTHKMVRKLYLIENCQQQIMREKCAGQATIRQERNTKTLQENKRRPVALGTEARSPLGGFASLIMSTGAVIFCSISLSAKAPVSHQHKNIRLFFAPGV